MSAERRSLMTESQKNLLIEFMKKNKDLQSGKFTNKFTLGDAKKKWNEIGDILNSMPGATRDWKSWRKTWQDLKSRTKTKASHLKVHASGTGGGPSIDTELSASERNIINILKPVAIEGHTEALESAVEFSFEETCPQQENEIIVVEVEPQPEMEDIRVEEVLEPNEPIPKRKRTTLQHTVEAVNEYKAGMAAKLSIKEKYYEEKLKLLGRIAAAEEKKAEALVMTAQCNSRIADALEILATRNE